ncbi:MAG: hypothetical protein IPM29_24280 [Planctomycetes bacterium]|nr:hypothetical protein [Planctomycetota bacterium]
MRTALALHAAVLAAAASLAAQSVVVPNANATTRGTTQLNTIIRNAANPRTYMLGINASELAGIPVGAMINGVSLRFQAFGSNAATWPAQDILWTDYEIYAGPCIPTATFTGSFLANFVSQPLMVRDGPMVLPANSFTNTSPPSPTPNDWSEFYFDFQVPFAYQGGDLGLLFSHPGSTDPATAQYPETVPSSSGTHGVAFTQSTFPVGTGGVSTAFYVHRLHYGYGTGCPGTGGLTPVLVQNQNLVGGGTALFTLSNCPANAPAAFVFGVGQANIPLFNGCTLLTLPAVSAGTLLDANGRGRIPLVLLPSTIGVMSVQGAVIDAGGPAGFTTSNGVELTAS